MKKALFSGSFDPITKGHVDIVRRAARLFDEVYVVAFANSEKKGMFTLDERLEIIRSSISGIDGAVADAYEGTVADYVIKNKIDVIVRGIRSPLDCQYEVEMSDANRTLSGVDTVMLACDAQNSRISSTVVREMLRIGKPVFEYVTEDAEKKICEILKENR